VTNQGVDVCSPLLCESRSPNTPTLCVVFEDAASAVECAKVDDSTCSVECPNNMAPVQSSNGWVCEGKACIERIPYDGVCSVSGDGTSYCYSLVELDACYSNCPFHTTPNTQTSGNPKCVVTACSSRAPDPSRGVCLLSQNEECYAYDGECVDQCPEFTVLGSNLD
jgi:hypothetical protein